MNYSAVNYNCNGNWRKVVAFFGTKRLWHGPTRTIRNDPRAVPRDRQCAQRPSGAAHLAAKANDPTCPAVSTSAARMSRICRPRLQNLPPGTFFGLECGEGCGNYRKPRRGGFSSPPPPFFFGCLFAPRFFAARGGAAPKALHIRRTQVRQRRTPIPFPFSSDECSP